MKMIRSLLMATSCVAMFSCAKESKTADGTATDVGVNLKAVNPSSVVLRTAQLPNGKTAGVNLVWNAATASANLLKFEAEKGGVEVEYKSKVQQTVDLFNASVSLGNISIPNGTYDEVEVKAALSPNGTAAALQMKGTLTNSTGTTQVTFTANEPLEIKGEKHNVTISNATVQNADIPLDFSLLVKGITATEFDAATRSNGSLLISAADNANLYGKIIKNLRELKQESEFHH